jgi:hypothetical protein
MSTTEHKAKFTADNSDFNKKADQLASKSNWLGGKMKALGGAIIAAFSVRAIVNFGKEAVELAAKIEGVRVAFNRLNSPDLLKNLREATRGTVTDLDLMTAAVRANNFQIPLEKLATFFEFATKRAMQTGESVDYLVESIVLGIGRKSPLILDNLGISAVRLREKFGDMGVEMAGVGDVAAAVGDIVEEELTKMGEVADTAATKIASLKTAWTNFKTSIGEKIAATSAFSNIIKTLENLVILMQGEDIKSLGREDLLKKEAELQEKVLGYEGDIKKQEDEINGLKWYQVQRQKDLKFQAEATWEHYVKTKQELQEIRDLLKTMPAPAPPPKAGGGKAAAVDIPYIADVSQLQMPSFVIKVDSSQLIDGYKNAGALASELSIAEQAALAFGDAMMDAGKQGASSMEEFGKVALMVAKKVIIAYVAEAIAGAVKSALVNVPFPFNIAAAGIAAGLAAGALSALIPDFAAGGAVSGPTLALVGEAPGISKSNPEYIGTAAQMGQMGMGGRSLTARVSRGDLLFILNEGNASNTNNY